MEVTLYLREERLGAEVAEVGRVNTLDDELPDGEAVLPIFQYLYLCVHSSSSSSLSPHLEQ